jgi:hypothetical protein
LHLPVFRQIGVPGLQLVLDGHPTLDCIDHARKLGQEIVARRVYHSTPVLLDQGEHHLFVSLKGPDGCRFVFTHQPAIPGHVSTKNGGQLTLEVLSVHGITPQMKKPPQGSLSPSEASLSNPSGGMFSWPSQEG